MPTHTLMPTYARLPVALVRGEGVMLYDDADRAYLDAVSGIAVSNLGHAHPALNAALAEQAGRVWHTSNLYRIPAQEALADTLTGLAGMETAFFANSGAEANEAAIKLARLYGHRRGIDNPAIVVMEGAFHGRTLATLSASGSRKIQAGFEPLVTGFVRAPFNDLEAVAQIAEHNPRVVAVLVEPIQGESGVQMPDPGYLAGLRTLCDRHDWLLMLDEVQTGNGRTGTYFAYQQPGVPPDVVTTAKGLGNGLPIGACLARGAAAECFSPGHHGSTFGGNPLVCTVAHAVVDTLLEQKLSAQAARVGGYLRDRLAACLAETPGVIAIRGQGQMTGIELDRPCTELVQQALDAGLLINVTAERVIRLLPPLILEERDADTLVERLCPLIETHLASTAA